MFQLILTLLAISLSTLQLVASLNFSPLWPRVASDVDYMSRVSMQSLSHAFDVGTASHGGVPPSVTADPDGGLQANFGALIHFTPAAPPGYSWRYGQHTNDGSAYANMYYFCMAPTVGSTASQGVYRGIVRSTMIYPANQVYVNAACDATSSMGEPASYPAPVALTMFVAYVP